MNEMREGIQIAFLGLLGLLTALSFGGLLWRIFRDEDVDLGVWGQWAGFGGGRSGWRLSPALVLLFLTVFFGLAFAAAGTYSAMALRPLENGGKPGEREKPAAANGGVTTTVQGATAPVTDPAPCPAPGPPGAKPKPCAAK
jgi:hypothetical protein